MKFKIFLILALAAMPLFAAPQKREFVGYRHRGVLVGEKLPNGAKDLGGGLLSDDRYGVSRYIKGKRYMLWLEKITGRDGRGVPSWQVKDVLSFDPLKKNQEFLFSHSSTCTQNGRSNLDLIVKAELDPKTKKYKVLDVWRANVRREKFEKVSEKGIVCQYDIP